MGESSGCFNVEMLGEFKVKIWGLSMRILPGMWNLLRKEGIQTINKWDLLQQTVSGKGGVQDLNLHAR